MKQSVVGLLFGPDKKSVLLIQRRDVPVWVLPGGALDANELAESACVREMFEETGIEVCIKRKVGNFYPTNCLTGPTSVFECASKNAQKEQLLPQKESRRVAYHSIDRLPELFFPLHKEWLDEALQDLPYPVTKPIKSINLGFVLKNLFLHPFLIIRYFLARAGLPINSKSTYDESSSNVCVHGYVSDAPCDVAGADARIAPEVNGQRPALGGRSTADAPAPSEEQALNTCEHIPSNEGTKL